MGKARSLMIKHCNPVLPKLLQISQQVTAVTDQPASHCCHRSASESLLSQISQRVSAFTDQPASHCCHRSASKSLLSQISQQVTAVTDQPASHCFHRSASKSLLSQISQQVTAVTDQQCWTCLSHCPPPPAGNKCHSTPYSIKSINLLLICMLDISVLRSSQERDTNVHV